MKTWHALSQTALAAVLFAGCATLMPPDPEGRRALADLAVSTWYAPCRTTAVMLMGKYGAPDEIKPGSLVWHERSPWKRITVRDGILSDEETLEQTIAYAGPAGAEKALAAFSGGITHSKWRAELSSRSTTEELNYLSVNLAHDIIAGKIDPREARVLYSRKLDLAIAGKTVPEMQRLMFRN